MINMIVASNNEGCIGKDNKLCWKSPEDLKRFKELTTNNVVIMGRQTFEGLPFILPNRISIVITRNKDYQVQEGVYLAHSIEEAIDLAKTLNKNEIFVIGGAEIYNQSIDFIDKIYWTIVDVDVEGDTYLDREKLTKDFVNTSGLSIKSIVDVYFYEYKRKNAKITQEE